MNEISVRMSSDVNSLVLVDFDYTLFGCNSTELFIASSKPSALIAVIDFLIRRCIPWHLFGVEKSFRLRDYVCVLAIALLTPWNLLIWRYRAPRLFQRYQSLAVAEAVEMVDSERLTIISFGMRLVIGALVSGSRFANVRIIATPLWSGLARFHRGKRDLAIEVLGWETARAATLLTDSDDDADLLAYCRNGILIAPQGEGYLAREHLFLPCRYMATVKFTRSFVLDQLLLVDAALYVISTSHDFRSFLARLVICPFFVLSQTCVYEMGYFENDMYAAKHEAAPVLGSRVARYRNYPIRFAGWLWSAILAAAGFATSLMLGEIAKGDILGMCIKWATVLIGIRLLFFIYNRLRTTERTVAYPFLQLLKYGAILAIFPATIIGLLLVLAQIVMMWMNYILYRLGGATKDFQKEQVRTLLFVFSVLLFYAGTRATIFAARGAPTVEIFCLGTALAWCLFRIAKAKIMKQVKAKVT